MDFLTLMALAFALAMDAFAVSVATGVCIRRASWRQTFRLAWHFGLFQALMPVLGWWLGMAVRGFVESYAPWIAFAMLAWVGGKMIKEAFADDDEREERGDPTRGKTLMVLSVATSIDALAVGLSLSLLGVSVWTPALVIGLVCLGCSAAGLHMGCLVSGGKRLARHAEIMGGVTLILIGVNMLLRTKGLGL